MYGPGLENPLRLLPVIILLRIQLRFGQYDELPLSPLVAAVEVSSQSFVVTETTFSTETSCPGRKMLVVTCRRN